MTSSKPWWKSRGVWGALTAVLTSTVTLVVYGLAASGVIPTPMLVVVSTAAVTLAGSLLALVGRILADQPIKRKWQDG